MRDASVDASVRPRLEDLVALRALAHARGTPRRGRSGVAGRAPAPLRGRGMEYAESREYTAGDDARHIDWRVTARTGRAHTKLYHAERDRLTLLVADTTAALYFGTRTRFKSVQAARAGAIATWAAARDGDRVAALRGGSEPPVPAATGQRGALRVLDALVRWYRAPPADDRGLDAALAQARRLLRPGSRLLVLADPGSVAAVGDERWTTLAMHHDVLVLLLVDPLECRPPAAALRFVDPGGARTDLDLAASAQRARWRNQFDAPVAAALTRLPARGVHVEVLSSDAPGDGWLPAFSRRGR